MASDGNKKSAPSEGNDNTASKARVGDGQGVVATSKFIVNHRRLTIRNVLFVIIGLLLISWLAVSLHVGQKVYAQAAGHKIYKSDVEQLINGAKGISDHEAATVLADKYLTRAMAKDQKVTVTDNDIEKAYGSSIKEQKSKNPYSYQLQVNQLYFAKLQASYQGVYKGDAIVANFSRHILYDSPLASEQKALDPEAGNPQAIARDKQYAKTLIDNLYSQIKSGKITFQQAIETANNDPIIGTSAYPTLPHSGPFDTGSTYVQANPLIKPQSVMQKLQSMHTGQISQPFVVPVFNSTKNDSTTDSYFLVLRLNSSYGGGHGSQSFQDYLVATKGRLGYKVYV